ncbi:MAG: tyrosine-type recombinase/integrase [Desulfarculaceae bacterium]|nr:tyrosine-type recombinase/integrase [Desulfarculaceae bacterium]MCF8073169.1 tyrosine-type recombinase/integrase [Desulfarculaceae bacterium]MCF8100765.1 tyrosine-type recombinase/integrase [Desulfarculaceae bacterium]MCF8118412.1 tyrosine-type recombinase/integrase [Desulfarculaceae bacterium]
MTVCHLEFHGWGVSYSYRPIQRITRSFQNACTRAGLTDFTFHDLRHTFNTNMRKAGVDQSVIMKMTEHRTAAMFERYNTIDKHDAIDAMARLDGFLSAPKSPESPDIVQTGEK